MGPGVLTPTEGEPYDPENEKDDRGDPQKVYCKSGTKEDQDQQQRKNEQHETTQPF